MPGFLLNKIVQCPAKFFEMAVENVLESKASGAPVFEAQDHIKIYKPNGDCVIRRAVEQDLVNYADIYKLYKLSKEQIPDGFPIKEWPEANIVQVAAMKKLNIHTIEQLANSHDKTIKKLGVEGNKLRNKAQKFTGSELSGVLIEKQALVLDKQAESIARLEEQIKQLTRDKRPALTKDKSKTKTE